MHAFNKRRPRSQNYNETGLKNEDGKPYDSFSTKVLCCPTSGHSVLHQSLLRLRHPLSIWWLAIYEMGVSKDQKIVSQREGWENTNETFDLAGCFFYANKDPDTPCFLSFQIRDKDGNKLLRLMVRDVPFQNFHIAKVLHGDHEVGTRKIISSIEESWRRRWVYLSGRETLVRGYLAKLRLAQNIKIKQSLANVGSHIAENYRRSRVEKHNISVSQWRSFTSCTFFRKNAVQTITQWWIDA